MRFEFDKRKSGECRKNPGRGIGFEEVQQLWEKPYYLDQRSEEPGQWREIGWVGDRLFSVICEERSDKSGEYPHLVTPGNQRKKNGGCMKKTLKAKIIPKAEHIAAMADQGKDISSHFTNTGKMMPATRRVNVDFADDMLRELDGLVRKMNVSRQAVIKSFLRQGLDQHYLAGKHRPSHAFSK